MAFTQYADFLPTMRPQLPDCSTELITQALHTATREFCFQSEALIQTQTALDLVADQKDYTVTIPTDMELVRVFQVNKLTETDVTDGNDGIEVDPSEYYFDYPTTLTFYTAPSAENVTSGLVLKFVLELDENPADADTNMDFDFVNRWSEGIRSGALASLMSQQKKPWYDPVLSQVNMTKFRMQAQLARREAHIQYTTRNLTLRGRNFL